MELFVVKLNQRGPTRTGQSASEGDATSPSRLRSQDVAGN